MSDKLNSIFEEISKELERAVKRYPTWPADIIHASNIVTKESGELAKACNEIIYEFPRSTIIDVRKEAIQTAAAAIRFLLSIDGYDGNKSKQISQEL